MSDNVLVLHPRDPAHVPDRSQLVGALETAGFLGQSLGDTDAELRYALGVSAEELLVLRGTHVVVTLHDHEPTTIARSGVGTHVTVPAIAPRVSVIASQLSESPLCRHCGHAFDGWPDMIDRWYASDDWRCTCPSCSNEARLHELDWRQRLGFARASVRIWGVHAGEVELSNRLFELLRATTGCDWGHLYYRL